MQVISSFKKSNTTRIETLSGGQIHNDPVAEGYLSLGGFKSSYLIPNAKIGGLFEEVTVEDSVNGRMDVKCIFLKNESGGSVSNLSLVIAGNKSFEKFYVGLSIPTSKINGSVQRLQTTQEEPYGVDFELLSVNPLIFDGITLENGEMIALWIKRIILSKSELGVEDITLKQQSSVDFVLSYT